MNGIIESAAPAADAWERLGDEMADAVERASRANQGAPASALAGGPGGTGSDPGGMGAFPEASGCSAEAHQQWREMILQTRDEYAAEGFDMPTAASLKPFLDACDDGSDPDLSFSSIMEAIQKDENWQRKSNSGQTFGQMHDEIMHLTGRDATANELALADAMAAAVEKSAGYKPDPPQPKYPPASEETRFASQFWSATGRPPTNEELRLSAAFADAVQPYVRPAREAPKWAQDLSRPFIPLSRPRTRDDFSADDIREMETALGHYPTQDDFAAFAVADAISNAVEAAARPQRRPAQQLQQVRQATQNIRQVKQAKRPSLRESLVHEDFSSASDFEVLQYIGEKILDCGLA